MAFSKKPAEPKPIDFTVVFDGQHSLVDTAAVMLIDNKDDWGKIWQLAQGDIYPIPRIKKIDFEQQMIIAAFMGKKNSGGYRIEIAEINETNNTLAVKINNYSSGGGMMLPVLTTPCQLVSIPKGDYKIKVEYSDVKE